MTVALELIRRDAHGDHVALDELAQLDAGVEPPGHEIHRIVLDLGNVGVAFAFR